MATAKLFKNGQSQAVRLPKEYRFSGSEVNINRVGDAVILLPADHPWSGFTESLSMFSEDFMAEGRADQGIPGEREAL